MKVHFERCWSWYRYVVHAFIETCGRTVGFWTWTQSCLHRGFLGATFFLTECWQMHLIFIFSTSLQTLHFHITYIIYYISSGHYTFTETHEMLCGIKSFISLWHKLSWVQHLSWTSSDFWRPPSNWALVNWAPANWAPGKLGPWCFCHANWYQKSYSPVFNAQTQKYKYTTSLIHRYCIWLLAAYIQYKYMHRAIYVS